MRILRNHTEKFLGRNTRNSWEEPWENKKKSKGEIPGKGEGHSWKTSWDIPRKQRGDSWKAITARKCLENIVGVSRKQHVELLENT